MECLATKILPAYSIADGFNIGKRCEVSKLFWKFSRNVVTNYNGKEWRL